MNAGLMLIVALPVFWLAYKFYGRYVAGIFQADDANPTPAQEMYDGVDYVPTKPLVLFGHHFASIAGAMPIVGPTIAMIFGFIPVWLWLVLGSIFVGAVHDFAALFTSIREKGKSMAQVAEQSFGRLGFILFIAFTVVLIVIVTAIFLRLTAAALTSLVPLSALGMPESQTVLKTVTVEGVIKAKIGGIASTSVIIITGFAPILGYLLYRRRVSPYVMAVLAVAVCFVSVFVGMRYPLSISETNWTFIVAAYTLFAAGIPVWIILQPRDFTNVFLLYTGIVVLTLGGLLAVVKGVPASAPAWNVAAGTAKLGLIWPILFVTVACGACSGFHALVAGGTTAKQCARESHARKIGYGGMILEALMAVGVLTAVSVGIDFEHYTALVFPTDGSPSNPVAAFAVGMGGLLYKTLGIPAAYGTIFGMLLVEGFLVTTLDTAVRLNRYLYEELWGILFKAPPAIFKTYIFNSALSVIPMVLLAYYKTVLALLPIFGSANQLLAALTLIAVAVWLVARGRRFLFALLPAAFMMVTTVYSLIYLLRVRYLPKHESVLIAADGVLLVLALLVIGLAAKSLLRSRKIAAEVPTAAPEVPVRK